MTEGGRVAVVTGAASGIGLGIAEALLRAGYRIVGLDSSDEREAFEAAVREADGGAVAGEPRLERVDVTDHSAVTAAFEAIAKDLGSVDVLVNSAGIRDIGGALEIDLKEWQRVIDVDLTGTFICCRAAGAVMVRQGRGSIINVASIAGMRGFSHRVAYTAAKHGVIGLTRALASEWGPSGVRVNALCPGMVQTPLTASYVEDANVLASFRALVPAQRAGVVQEMGDVAVFLAGDQSRFVTGVALPVDGGFTAAATYDITGDSPTFARRFSVTED